MLHLLGIRHHGTGSARHVVERLDALRPDLVLVEGPPEFDPLLQWVGQPELVPPVALLGYDTAAPQRASFYPFAEYSPEWQAIAWANAHRVPVRMLDLPLAVANFGTGLPESTINNQQPDNRPTMADLAALDGYADSEQWWEERFERPWRPGQSEQHFEAVLLAMSALREANATSALDAENEWREAWMRQIIRAAQREMYSEIAVVCGAWHAPALLDVGEKSARADAALLKKLPKSKIKIAATWAPWTTERLALRSGYGAGISTPGWSAHRWAHPGDDGSRWLSRVARVLRERGMDISTAHVLEASRLATALAHLRGQPHPALNELDEAAVSTMCQGDAVRLRWVHTDLTVGKTIGQVPDTLPKLPLEADFDDLTRRLKIKPEEGDKTLKLDLRNFKNQVDRGRSTLLHRLLALGVRWGTLEENEGSLGTFTEVWNLNWRPELLIDLIEKAPWGHTVESASAAWLLHRSEQASTVGEVSELVQQAVPAELYAVIEPLLQRLNTLAAVASDVVELMGAIAPLADLGRYGDVRQTDLSAVLQLLEGLLVRVCVGLPNAVVGLNDEAAGQLMTRIRQISSALHRLQRIDLQQQWQQALRVVPQQTVAHPLVRGGVCRLLFDAQVQSPEVTEQEFGRALSRGEEPAQSAAWLEGFLPGSAQILLHDHQLWNLLYVWTEALPEEQFTELLPILRRTFAHYPPGERQRLGEQAKRGVVDEPVFQQPATAQTSTTDWDEARGEQAVSAVLSWL